ncbi:MAG: ChbG/HpnK family deacetylase [Alphaproteobacteria bacterium]
MSHRRFVLCADDYAISHGVCDGILALAEKGRISAATAMVTTDLWPARAADLVAQRDRIALGLHINLTHGAARGHMSRTAPTGTLPPVGRLIARSLTSRLAVHEIRAEVDRQLQAFAEHAGPPDFVDGHQHVHVLPSIRRIVLEALAEQFRGRNILLRDPSDRWTSILKRRASAAKAVKVKLLASGYRGHVRGAGFTTNHGFSGFSGFGPAPYESEFERYLLDPGEQQLIMCHPGRAESDLAWHDPIAERRPQELDYLARREGLAALLWRPDRTVTGDRGAFSEGASA